jgi:hypothetical protein
MHEMVLDVGYPCSSPACSLIYLDQIPANAPVSAPAALLNDFFLMTTTTGKDITYI